MPVPIVDECDTAMSAVRSAAGKIESAISAVRDLANADTWSGPPADRWMVDLGGFTTDALNSLGEPLDDAIQDCRDNARRLQAETSNPSG